jgi:signal peptidase I
VTETSPSPLQSDVATPRRSWVAVLLSLLLPGLGHVYAGAPRRALFVYLLSLLVGAVAVTSLTILSATSLPLVLVLVGEVIVGVLFATLVARDAVLQARRAGADYVLRHYNRWYVYAALFLVSAFLVQPGYVRLFHGLIQAYQIPNSSMEPTLLVGDYIFAKPIRRAPNRGDVVILLHPRGLFRVKRVVGMPGDTLAMEAGVLSVNGHPNSEPYASHAHERSVFDADFMWQRRFLTGTVDTAAYHPTSTFWGPIVVPVGHYFVLGDNRGESADSRYWGFVAADSVVQRPTVVYFSRDPLSHSVRWSRIGTRLNLP